LKKNSIWATLALLAVAATWGAAFVLMKDAINRQPFMDFLATRMTIAVAVMALAQPKRIARTDRETIKYGTILGLLLAGGYITQTIGLELSTAAITGFITGLYVVLTPILGWLILKKKTTRKVWFGVALATIGLALISIKSQSLSIGTGELWVALCALLFAAHIVGLGRWSPNRDPYALTVIQLSVVAIACWALALKDGYQVPPDPQVWIAVIFTAVLSTAVAFLVQTWAQGHMDPSRVAIILTAEVVFAALFSVAVGQEQLALKTIIGGTLLIAAMLLVEWPTRKTRDFVHPPTTQ
jgi:drug/metabolite transporter (DMT)-like permease